MARRRGSRFGSSGGLASPAPGTDTGAQGGAAPTSRQAAARRPNARGGPVRRQFAGASPLR